MTIPRLGLIALLATGAAGLVTGAFAQGAPAVAPAAPAAPGAAAAATPQDEGIREVAPAPGGYTYNSGGRRDPFMSLVQRGSGTGKDQRPIKTGLEGLLIQELALRGILKDQNGYLVFLSGPDGKSYWPRVGQRFFDGQLVGIDATTATFRQEVSDPLSPVRTRDVKKYLYPTEEATQ